MKHTIEESVPKKMMDYLCDLLDQMPQDLKKMMASRSADDQRCGLQSIICRFRYYVRKEAYEPLCRAAWIDFFVRGGLFPLEVFQEDWKEYAEEILELLKDEQMLLDRIDLCYPLFEEKSQGDMIRNDYWKIRQNLTAYLVYAYFYCGRMGECREYLDEAWTYTKRNIRFFFKELRKRPDRTIEIGWPEADSYTKGVIWLDPLHWIAMESGYGVFTRIVFPYYWHMLMYLEEQTDEGIQGNEVKKLLYHVYWKMDTLAEFAYFDLLGVIEDSQKVVSFQNLEKQYFASYIYAHGRLGELHRFFRASERKLDLLQNIETENAGLGNDKENKTSFFAKKYTKNTEIEIIACPYKDELTPYERYILKEAVYTADFIVTDGYMAVGLSYKPEERGDYAPVTMGYVREEKSPGILGDLEKRKHVVHDAALTRYLHSFDNPYWEIPVGLYQDVARLYAEFYREMEINNRVISIDEWKNDMRLSEIKGRI